MKRDPVMVILLASLCLSATVGSAADKHGTEDILSMAPGGLIVQLGCGDGSLAAALGEGGKFVVHSLDANNRAVEKTRDRLRDLGIYGNVSVQHWVGKRLPYADNLANLIVSESSLTMPKNEIMRVLAPGGTLCVKEDGAWQNTVKPWPDEMDEWTHWKRAADGNMVSQDELIGPPREMRWTCGPLWQRHHGAIPSITTMVSAKGRMFYIMEEVPMSVNGLPGDWKLIARDAFNGVRLWDRPINDWGTEAWSYWSESHSSRFNHPIHIRKRLVAEDDRVYVTLGVNAPVSVLDATTGGTIDVYEGTEFTDEIVLFDDVLYLAVNDRLQKPWPGEGLLPEPSSMEDSKKRVWAIDTTTGKVLWRSREYVGKRAKPDRLGAMKHLTLLACEKGVYIADEKNIIGLDAKTGKERWSIPQPNINSESHPKQDIGKLYHNLVREGMPNLVYYEGVLLAMHSGPNGGYKWSEESELYGLDPETGKELWRYVAMPINYLDEPDILCTDGLVWMPHKEKMVLAGLDPETGEEKRKFDISDVLDTRHHHRCYPNRATPTHLILARRGAEFVDVKTGEITQHHWMRSACRYGHLLANGLIYKMPDHCKCYIPTEPRGFLALAPESTTQPNQRKNILEKGPAYGKLLNGPAGPDGQDDWPVFRHDPYRSSMTKAPISTDLKEAWRINLGGKITPPVIAAGKIFVAATDEHTVYALDATNGEKLWTFTAGAPIDSPPSIERDAVIFGCGDGWVYCLRTSDGTLAWRFRAAPRDRWIMSFEHIESTWPVNGSVLVAGDTAYFTAGRSSLIDDGITAYALDIKTGDLIESIPIQEEQHANDRDKEGFPEGALADILVTDGENIYLRDRILEFTKSPSESIERSKPELIAPAGFLDSQWFHRVEWSLKAVKGSLIAFDDKTAYAVEAYVSHNPSHSFFIPGGGRTDRIIGLGLDEGPGWLRDIRVHSGGYHLYAADRDAPVQRTETGAGDNLKITRTARTIWSNDSYQICPWTMVAAPGTLFVAGFRNEIDKDDPWSTFEGRRGGVLSAISADDGKTLADYKLDAPPVWNGMAAANGRLFIALRNGEVVSMR